MLPKFVKLVSSASTFGMSWYTMDDHAWSRDKESKDWCESVYSRREGQNKTASELRILPCTTFRPKWRWRSKSTPEAWTAVWDLLLVLWISAEIFCLSVFIARKVFQKKKFQRQTGEIRFYLRDLFDHPELNPFCEPGKTLWHLGNSAGWLPNTTGSNACPEIFHTVHRVRSLNLTTASKCNCWTFSSPNNESSNLFQFPTLNIKDIYEHFYISEDVVSLTGKVILHECFLPGRK